MFVGRILAALCSIFVAECLRLSAFAVEVTQPAGAAHGYPGLYDANGKKLANAEFKQWLEDGHLYVVITYRLSDGQLFEEKSRFRKERTSSRNSGHGKSSGTVSGSANFLSILVRKAPQRTSRNTTNMSPRESMLNPAGRLPVSDSR